MIVPDGSSEMYRSGESSIVPHSIDVEAMSAFRRLMAKEQAAGDRGEEFIAGLAALPAERYGHTPLLGRIWELRASFSAYDAAYIALAEAMDAVLYTADKKLCKGHRARVMLFEG